MSMSFATKEALFQLENAPNGNEAIEAAEYILGEIDAGRPADPEKVERLEMGALMELLGALNAYRVELQIARQNAARIILALVKQYNLNMSGTDRLERELETLPDY